MAKTESSTLGLYLNTIKKDGYFHLILNPVLKDAAGSVTNVSESFDLFDGGKYFLHNLEINSQGQEDSRDTGLYGWEARFAPYRVDLGEAKRMVKTLTRVRRVLDRLYNQRGTAATYGEFVARVAEAINAKFIAVPVDDGQVRWRSYSERAHRFYNIGDGRTHIDWLEKQWKEAAA